MIISTGTCRMNGISFISALMNSPIPCPMCFKGSVTKLVKVIANAQKNTNRQTVLLLITNINMNSLFRLDIYIYLCWWNQQNRIYQQSFIVLLTGIVLKCPFTSEPFCSQSRDVFLLLFKNTFYDTVVIQKVAFQLQMEKNSSRYGSKLRFIFN